MWVPFRSPDMAQASHYWMSMLGFAQKLPSVEMLHSQIFNARHVFEMLVCAIAIWQPAQAHLWVEKLTPLKLLVVSVLFFIAIVGMFTSSFNPFLYFQF
jgi:alginate O-acetyltransferase complex protein AlgI